MKHLKKYNESISEVDPEYIKLVFADYIDEGSNFQFVSANDNDFNFGVNTASLDINLPSLRHDGNGHELWTKGDIDYFINNSKEVTDRYEDIKVCIKRVLDKYPQVEHEINKEVDHAFKEKATSFIYVYFNW